MRGELLGEGVDDEAGVSDGEVTKDVRFFLLVAAHGVHGGQGARDGVRTGRDGLTERERSEGGHAGKLRAES
jgi:hypothetical protein